MISCVCESVSRAQKRNTDRAINIKLGRDTVVVKISLFFFNLLQSFILLPVWWIKLNMVYAWRVSASRYDGNIFLQFI